MARGLSSFLADTDIFIDYLNGIERMSERVSQGGRLLSCQFWNIGILVMFNQDSEYFHK